jgi:hypothetical protein
VHRTSAGVPPHFRDSGPNGGFGVWWLCPPIPALAGNACRWALSRITLQKGVLWGWKTSLMTEIVFIKNLQGQQGHLTLIVTKKSCEML